jgi:hypothetical protein
MKKLRRVAVLFCILLLGLVSWFAVILCWRTEGELRLSRELSSGRLVARVPVPKKPFLNFFAYERPVLSVRYSQPARQISGALSQKSIVIAPAKSGAQAQVESWLINLDPLDKSWELEITERRPVQIRFAGKAWRIGTKTRIWRTHRVLPPEESSLRDGSESRKSI